MNQEKISSQEFASGFGFWFKAFNCFAQDSTGDRLS
jgi:hypothetical protein